MSVISKLDELIKSVEEALEKGNFSTRLKSGNGAWGAQSKSKAQIAKEPQGSTGKEVKVWTDEEKAKYEPQKKKLLRSEEEDKAEKADAPKPPKAPGERTLDYGAMKKPKAVEADAPTISYSNMAAPTRTPGASSAESGFKIPKEKKKPLADPKFRSKLAEQRRASGFTKSEDFGKITESLTKSMRAQHSDGVISEMLKAAVDANQLHTNVLIEWINYRTINPAVMGLVQYEDEA